MFCKNCGLPLDRNVPEGSGRIPEYCLQEECVKERKNRKMREIYYRKTNRPELAQYARNH